MTQTATSRQHYAVEWPYGSIAWSSEHGTPSTAIAFQSAAARDAWVNKGNPYITQPGYREALTAAEVRAHKLEIVDIDELECWEE
jgi:hypothetical protein